MYPGQANSPQTEIVSAIDSTQTTITVLNGNALPNAPNLATIGSGEDAETILYASKSGNVLSDVVRGFQGTVKSWQSGARVARNFTAYDYDTLRENIEDLDDAIDNIEVPVTSVNNKIGDVMLNADDVGATSSDEFTDYNRKQRMGAM